MENRLIFDKVTVTESLKVGTFFETQCTRTCELDSISTWLLKQLAPYIAPVICCLCNLSLEQGVFPVLLKQAHVLPLLKKLTLDPDEVSSYRPISNLSYLSKLIERVQSSASAAVSLTTLPLDQNSSAVSPQRPCPLHRQWQSVSLSSWISVRLLTPLITSCSCQF